MTDDDEIIDEISEDMEDYMEFFERRAKERERMKKQMRELAENKEELLDKIKEIEEDEEQEENNDYPWGGREQKREYIQFMTWMKSEFYQKYGDALTERDNLAIEMFWNYMKQEHMNSKFVPETMDNSDEE